MQHLGLALATTLSLFALASGSLSVERAPPVSDDGAAPLQPAPMQGTCGDGQCQPPDDCHSCPEDCGSCCGNGRCEPPEDCRSCDRDCGRC